MLHTLARADALPTHLVEVALRGSDPAWLSAPEHREERAKRSREFLDVLVAAYPREVSPPGSDEWTAVSMSPEDIPTMDQRDVDVIEDVILRLRTPAEVNGEVAATVADFRGQRDGDASGEDGGGLADTPEPAAVGA